MVVPRASAVQMPVLSPQEQDAKIELEVHIPRCRPTASAPRRAPDSPASVHTRILPQSSSKSNPLFDVDRPPNWAARRCTICKQKTAAFTQSSVRGRIRRLASPERAICGACSSGKQGCGYDDCKPNDTDRPPLYSFFETYQLPAHESNSQMHVRKRNTHKYVPLLTQISRRLVVESIEPKQKKARGMQGRNFPLDVVTRAEPRFMQDAVVDCPS